MAYQSTLPTPAGNLALLLQIPGPRTFCRVSMCSASPSFCELTALSFTRMLLLLNASLMVNISSSPTSRPLGSFSSTLRAAALLSLETAGSQGGGCEAGDGSMCVRHLVEHVCVGGAEGEGSMCGTDVQPAL